MAIRVTRTMAEVAGTLSANIRVTRTIAEVAGTVVQPDVRLYRFALQVLAEITSALEKTAQSTVTFSDSNNLSRPVSLSQTVTFSQSIGLVSTLQPNLSDTVTFSQVLAELLTLGKAASDTITFSQIANSSQKTDTVTQTVTFTDQANKISNFELSVADTITFSQILSALFPQTASDTVIFDHGGGAGVIIAGGIERNALPDTVIFSQIIQEVHCKGSATILTASDTVTFSESIFFPILVSIPQAFVLTQTALAELGYFLEHTVTFTQPEPIPISTRSPTVIQTVSFGHALAFTNRIDLCRYTPNIGESTVPNTPTPPPGSLTIVKQSSVTLSYPTVTPTLTVSIRAPELGEQQRLNFDRINRETRGGSLQIFSDLTWPKQESLELTFTGLKEAEAQAVLDFFQQTLGLEVKFEDWYSRIWHGFVTNPDSQLVRSRRGIVDLTFEFEGDQQ